MHALRSDSASIFSLQVSELLGSLAEMKNQIEDSRMGRARDQKRFSDEMEEERKEREDLREIDERLTVREGEKKMDVEEKREKRDGGKEHYKDKEIVTERARKEVATYNERFRRDPNDVKKDSEGLRELVKESDAAFRTVEQERDADMSGWEEKRVAEAQRDRLAVELESFKEKMRGKEAESQIARMQTEIDGLREMEKETENRFREKDAAIADLMRSKEQLEGDMYDLMQHLREASPGPNPSDLMPSKEQLMEDTHVCDALLAGGEAKSASFEPQE